MVSVLSLCAFFFLLLILTTKGMSMKTLYLLLAMAVFLVPSAAHADINFGIASNRGELKAKESWTDIATLLGNELGTRVNLVPVVIEKAVQAFGEKKVDYIVANPVIAAIVHGKYDGVSLATVDSGKGVEFGGVIFANKNSGVKTIEDMKGKKVMSYTKDSAGAYIFQAYEIKKRGLDIEKDFASFVVAKKQDDIPMVIKVGLFDVGFVRTGILESLEKKGLFKMDDFVIVNKIEDGFPEVHSTPLYPEWALVAQKDADPAVSEKISVILMNLMPDNPVLQKAGIKGFVKTKDLSALTGVLKELKVPPYDQ